MGNSQTTAQVLRPDGAVVEYDYPIQVAMLMILHPDYLVIQSPLGPVAPGERRNVKVMNVEDRLALGQTYIIYPIPERYRSMFEKPGQQHIEKSKKKRWGSNWSLQKLRRSFRKSKPAPKKVSGSMRGFTLTENHLEMQRSWRKSHDGEHVQPPKEIIYGRRKSFAGMESTNPTKGEHVRRKSVDGHLQSSGETRDQIAAFSRSRTKGRPSFSGQLNLQPVAEIEEASLIHAV